MPQGSIGGKPYFAADTTTLILMSAYGDALNEELRRVRNRPRRGIAARVVLKRGPALNAVCEIQCCLPTYLTLCRPGFNYVPSRVVLGSCSRISGLCIMHLRGHFRVRFDF